MKRGRKLEHEARVTEYGDTFGKYWYFYAWNNFGKEAITITLCTRIYDVISDIMSVSRFKTRAECCYKNQYIPSNLYDS